MAQYEILDSAYNDDTQTIPVLLGLKNIEEVNPPTTPLPGDPVDGIRWIRRVTEIFANEELEVHTSVSTSFGPGTTVLYLGDTSRLPNSGTLTVNRGSVNEEIISYTARDRFTNTVTGISDPAFTHVVGELVYPNVSTGFLGTFEVDLETSFTGGVRGPLRYGKTNVILNDIIFPREGKDYNIINTFVGDVCTRTQLRFNEGGTPHRFNPKDRIEVTYEFFVLYGDSRDYIQYYSSPDIISYIRLYQRETANIAFGTLLSTEKDTTPVGNIQIVPPLTSSVATVPPSTARILIKDIRLPAEVVTTTAPIGPTDTTIAVSDVSLFLSDSLANRTISINGNIITYAYIDKINSSLVGVEGISTTHSAGSSIGFNGTRVITTTMPIGLLDTTIAVSDISLFPTPGTLSDPSDDLSNRTISIDGDIITYTDIDKINKLLVGVSGISATHFSGTPIGFNGAKYVRDVIKNLINTNSLLRGSVEATSVDVGGYYLQIKVSSATGSLNLQPGTYTLWFIGFDDNYDSGLHRDITSSTSFENKDFTFARFQEIVSRQDVAKTLLGQTTSTRTIVSGTSPTDTTFDTP